MVDVWKADACNGCGMCADLCLNHAITLAEDEKTGFMYPTVNRKVCTKCGICVKQCPNNHPVRRAVRSEAKVYAAWSLNDEVRMLCGSGGLFYELASRVISGGVRRCLFLY